MKLLILFCFLINFNLSASSFSEIDLMTREALEAFYQNEDTTIDPYQDIFNLQMIEPMDLNRCDFEVSALVKYQKNQKQYAEYCQVCFIYLDQNLKTVDYVDYQVAFCF